MRWSVRERRAREPDDSSCRARASACDPRLPSATATLRLAGAARSTAHRCRGPARTRADRRRTAAGRRAPRRRTPRDWNCFFRPRRSAVARAETPRRPAGAWRSKLATSAAATPPCSTRSTTQAARPAWHGVASGTSECSSTRCPARRTGSRVATPAAGRDTAAARSPLRLASARCARRQLVDQALDQRRGCAVPTRAAASQQRIAAPGRAELAPGMTSQPVVIDKARQVGIGHLVERLARVRRSRSPRRQRGFGMPNAAVSAGHTCEPQAVAREARVGVAARRR